MRRLPRPAAWVAGMLGAGLVGVVALTAAGAVPAAGAVAAAGRGVPAGGGLRMAVNGANAMAPAVVLTNRTGAPCQVATTALGVVGVTSVSQGGRAVVPIATDPSFPDGLDVVAGDQLRTLAAGEAATVALPVVPVGPTGHAVESVTWSPEASLGELYPVAASGALVVTATYTPPPVTTGAGAAPLCPAAAAGRMEGAGAAGTPRSAGGSASGAWLTALAAAGVGVVVLALLVIVVVIRRGRRRRRGGGPASGGAGVGVAVVLAVTGLVALGTRPAAAAWAVSAAPATISVDPSLQSAYNQCAPTFSMAGGDPAGLFPTLNDPKNVVKIVPANGDQTHEIAVAGQIIIFWDPNDHHPYTGGGNADPCTSLYHEMYHGKEDLTGGQDHSPCVTAAGPSGLPTNEVNATKAQNVLRVKLGLPPRTTYGNTPLPAGPCLPKDQQPKQKPNCAGAGCGDSNGDPHLLTFDGVRYDFQAVGEFVATRAGDGSAFQVQVRQQPAGQATTVALTTAVAMSVAGDTVEIDLEPDGMTLIIGHRAAALASAALPHGGTVTWQPAAIPAAQLVVTWPDGSTAYVAPIGRYALHLTVHPVGAYRGKLAGLLGTYGGVQADDLRTAAGRPVPMPPAFGDLYPGYADSWRVTDATSLFTYPAGASTATYTDRSLPTAPPDVASLPGAAAAASLCQLVGVADPTTLTNCTLDVAETGQASFAGAALATQAIATPTGSPAPGPTSSSALGRTQHAILSVTRPNGAAKLTFHGVAGQRAFFSYTSTVRGMCGVVTFYDAAGGSLGYECTDSAGAGTLGGVLLPRTGSYSFVFTPPGGLTGTLDVTLTLSVDTHGVLPTDGSPVTVDITSPGQQGFLTFAGTAGERLLFEGFAPTIPSQCGLPDLLDPSGATIGIGCVGNDIAANPDVLDDRLLATSGQFTVVVHPASGETGSITLRLIVSHDSHGATAVGGPPVRATIAIPGQVAFYSFTVSSAQTITLTETGATIPSQCGVPALQDASGNTIGIGCINADHTGSDTFRLPAGGTYSVVINPGGIGTGSLTFSVRSG